MLVNADLHLHSRYSIGVSKNMTVGSLAEGSRKKGMQLLGSGDCLHDGWRAEVAGAGKVDDGTFELDGTRFVLTAEVEDSSRVHHLLLFPSVGKAEEFGAGVSRFSKNLRKSGRPNIALGGEDIAQRAKDSGALIGPSHAFTPWTSLYGRFDSLKDCYGDLAGYVSFVELGLSADTDYADRIGELADLTFLTNSDAHSPSPRSLAREFNRFQMDDATSESLRKAILRKGASRPALNVGLPPQEGKYNETACTRCYVHYDARSAMVKKWRCGCGGLIKKGVRDRVEELADSKEPKHPGHRPGYMHLIPLTEIISMTLGVASPNSKKVAGKWELLVDAFGSEVAVLVDAPVDDVEVTAGEDVASAVTAFRENRILIRPGGGGRYGRIALPGSPEAEEWKVIAPPTVGKRKVRTSSLLEF